MIINEYFMFKNNLGEQYYDYMVIHIFTLHTNTKICYKRFEF